MLQLKDMVSRKIFILILALVYHEVEGLPTSVLEELREQIQIGVNFDVMTDETDQPPIAQDRMGPSATSGFQVPAHITTLSNDQISNYLQSRVDSQPHLLSDAQILPGPEVFEDSQEEYDNAILSEEEASLEDQVLSEEDYGDAPKTGGPTTVPGHKNRKKHKTKTKDVSVEVHIDSSDGDKYLLGASSDSYGKYTSAVGGSHNHGNDVLMDLAPSWPPEFREPHKGSVDYVLIPMIMIGIIVPMFVVLYVVVGSMIAKMQPQSLLRRSLGPEEDHWTDLTLEILNLLDDWTFDS